MDVLIIVKRDVIKSCLNHYLELTLNTSYDNLVDGCLLKI